MRREKTPPFRQPTSPQVAAYVAVNAGVLAHPSVADASVWVNNRGVLGKAGCWGVGGMGDEAEATFDSAAQATVDALAEVRRNVLSDTLTFNRRKKQLAAMHDKCDAIMADCAAIKAVLDGDEGEAETEQPA